MKTYALLRQEGKGQDKFGHRGVAARFAKNLLTGDVFRQILMSEKGPQSATVKTLRTKNGRWATLKMSRQALTGVFVKS